MARVAMRKVRMALGVKRKASSATPAPISTTAPPTSTRNTPRTSSFRRQRARTPPITLATPPGAVCDRWWSIDPPR